MIVLHLSRRKSDHAPRACRCRCELLLHESIQIAECDKRDVGGRCCRPTKLWFTNIIVLRAKQEGRFRVWAQSCREDRSSRPLAWAPSFGGTDPKRDFGFLKPNLMAWGRHV